ncbi:MAG: tol-pal system protein YbgF, partial [Thermodesulfobacteriota bacterium]|nr:tol-pal system protein YbgF [Thermodesulfobacteriota bacterium]
DSCYSGTLFGQGRAMPSVITEKYYLDLYNEKSRWGMTSGNKEPVADRGTGGHSVFAYQLIKALEKSDKPYQSTQEIYTLIAPIVSNNSEQTPLCRPIRNTGDQGGEFVFVMSRDGAVATLPSPPTTPEGLPVESDVLTDDVLRPDGRDVDHPALKFRNSLDMMFVYLPPGVFEMGSPLDEPGRNDDELHHRVTLTRGFYMQTTEVTKGQWEAVMGTRPWSGKKYVIDNADSPAVFVSWEDCQEFIKEINRKEGVDKYGLPSEAEWEYACRARSATKYFFGRHDGGLMNYAWIKKNTWNLGRRYAHMVGTKKANPWGLFDMHGNVWEWCRDWYGEYPSSPVTDPEGPLWGTEKVLRGGSWLRYARYCRSASRFKRAMNVASRHIGFRLKAEVSPVRIPGAAEKAVSPDREFYESTLAMYREGRYEEAISDLRSLIKQHPDSALADNAQFWIGECYMSLKQYERAILAYQKVIHSRAKANSKVPNAMLRQGRAFFKKGDKTSSRLLLKKIIKKYPGSGEAKIAKKWLKAME